MGEMTQLTPAQQLVRRVRGDDFKQQAAMALPEGMPVERFVRATVTALLANPELAQQASHDTIFTALIRSAQDGLVPDGHEAALVVYSGKAVYMPMVGGLRKIAGLFGWALDTAVVKQADQFEYERGLEPKVRHVIRPGVERGQTIAAYCIARHSSGQKLVEVMMLDELEQIRATSKKPTSGPWKDWTDRMYEKTVGKRAFAKLPLGELDQRVVRVREAADAPPAEAERLIYGTVIDETPALPPASESHSVDGASSGTGEPAGADGAAQQAEAVTTPAASAPGFDPEEPGPADQSPFQAPTGSDDDPAVFAAKFAANMVMPIGKWQGMTLATIAADGNGPQYFRYALREFNDASGTGENANPKMRPGELVQALLAFCRVYLPDEYQAAMAAKEAAL